MTTTALRLRDAAFGYDGRVRVDRLTLDIPAGAAVALIGPNGSGKSTLLRGILGLADHLGGSMEVLGTDAAQARTRIGTLPQADSRNTDLPVTLRQVVTMGLYRRLKPLQPIGRAGHAAVRAALERVGLSQYAHRRFGELSGGQQQRGILARSLAANPSLLLLDEPFNGLDQQNRDMLLELVRELRDEGRTLLISTHDLEIAQASCTHVLLLAGGHGPDDPGHPASFGTLDDALTLEAVQHAFHEVTVELDSHTVTTTRETE